MREVGRGRWKLLEIERPGGVRGHPARAGGRGATQWAWPRGSACGPSPRAAASTAGGRGAGAPLHPHPRRSSAQGERRLAGAGGRAQRRGPAMATTSSTTGSTLLQPLSNAVQLPIDQVPASGASCPGRPCRLWCHPGGSKGGGWDRGCCARLPAGRGRAAGLVPSPVALTGASVPTQPPIAAPGGGGRGRRLGDSPPGRARQTCACACCRCPDTGRRTGPVDPGTAAGYLLREAEDDLSAECPGYGMDGSGLRGPALGDSLH